MNYNRELILNTLVKNGKLNHYCCKKEWYIKNNLLNIYELILSETQFLDIYQVSLRERIFYIQNDFLDVVKCKYCNFNKLSYMSSNVRFESYCLSKSCRSKFSSELFLKRYSLMSDEEKHKLTDGLTKAGALVAQKIKGKTFEEIYGQKKSKEIRTKITTALLNRPPEIVTKSIATRKNNNKPWHTPETLLKISQSNKITHSSKEFREKNKFIHDKSREKQSKTMKDKILRGEFTPCITNSWTHWESYIKNDDGSIKKFRSNWDAAFWLLNQNCFYEKIRIKYTIDEKDKIYIVDFVDDVNKKLYEIKPDSLKNKLQNTLKKECAINWCKNNGYEYVAIGDDWFKQNISKIDFNKHPYLEKSFKSFND